jgi:hypothetical protein
MAPDRLLLPPGLGGTLVEGVENPVLSADDTAVCDGESVLLPRVRERRRERGFELMGCEVGIAVCTTANRREKTPVK